MKNKTEEEMTTIEIDLGILDKEGLLNLIQFAHKNNFTFNEAIVTILKEYITTDNLQ